MRNLVVVMLVALFAVMMYAAPPPPATADQKNINLAVSTCGITIGTDFVLATRAPAEISAAPSLAVRDGPGHTARARNEKQRYMTNRSGHDGYLVYTRCPRDWVIRTEGLRFLKT